MRIYRVRANSDLSEGHGQPVTIGNFTDIDEAYKACKHSSGQGEDGDIFYADIPEAGEITDIQIFNLAVDGVLWYPAYIRQWNSSERRNFHVWCVDRPASAG